MPSDASATGVLDSIYLDDTTGVFGDPLDLLLWGPPHMAWTADSYFQLRASLLQPMIREGQSPMVMITITTSDSAVRVASNEGFSYRVLDDQSAAVMPTRVATATSSHSSNWVVLPSNTGFSWMQDLSCIRNPYLTFLFEGAESSCLYGYELKPGRYTVVVLHRREATVSDSTWLGWTEFARDNSVGGVVYKADTTSLTVLPASEALPSDSPGASRAVDEPLTLVRSILASTLRVPGGKVGLTVSARADTITEEQNSTGVIALVNSGVAVPVQHSGAVWQMRLDGDRIRWREEDTSRSSVRNRWMWLPHQGVLWRSFNLLCPGESLGVQLAPECSTVSVRSGQHKVVVAYTLETPNPDRRITSRDTLAYVVNH